MDSFNSDTAMPESMRTAFVGPMSLTLMSSEKASRSASVANPYRRIASCCTCRCVRSETCSFPWMRSYVEKGTVRRRPKLPVSTTAWVGPQRTSFPVTESSMCLAICFTIRQNLVFSVRFCRPLEISNTA